MTISLFRILTGFACCQKCVEAPAEENEIDDERKIANTGKLVLKMNSVDPDDIGIENPAFVSSIDYQRKDSKSIGSY